MKQLFDLDTFVKNLTHKGYNGYFHTQSAYPGKLKDSISEYLEACSSGKEHLPKGDLILTGYLQWAGDERPSVQCNLWVKHENGKFPRHRSASGAVGRLVNIYVGPGAFPPKPLGHLPAIWKIPGKGGNHGMRIA